MKSLLISSFFLATTPAFAAAQYFICYSQETGNILKANTFGEVIVEDINGENVETVDGLTVNTMKIQTTKPITYIYKYLDEDDSVVFEMAIQGKEMTAAYDEDYSYECEKLTSPVGP